MGHDDELVGLLLKRSELVDTLSGEEMGKGELAERLSVSPATVDRGLKELQIRGLVERHEPRVYRLTPYGQTLYEVYGVLVECFDRADVHRELFSKVVSFLEMEPSLLTDSEILYGGYSDADMDERVRHLLEGAESIEVAGGESCLSYVDDILETTLRGAETSLAFTGDAVDHLLSRGDSLLQSALESGNLELYRLEEEMPVGFGVVDTGDRAKMCISSFPVEGSRSVLISSSREAVESYRGLFREYVEAATQVSTSGSED